MVLYLLFYRYMCVNTKMNPKTAMRESDWIAGDDRVRVFGSRFGEHRYRCHFTVVHLDSSILWSARDF